MLLSELARRIGAQHTGEDVEVADLCSAFRPKPGCMAYAEEEKTVRALFKTPVSAILSGPFKGKAEKPLLIVENPKKALAEALQIFRPSLAFRRGIDDLAWVSREAVIGEEVYIGPFAVVEEGARVGAGTTIYPFVYVGRGVVIGKQCTLYPGSVVMEGSRLGERVVLKPGAIVGAEGFGFYRTEQGKPTRIPQRGGVVLENDVEVGANSAVDAGTIDPSIIQKDTKLDNLVQVGHNVHIGEKGLIAGQVGFAGSVSVGKEATIGGQVGFKDHVKVGDKVSIGGQSGVFGDIPDGATVSGYPALPHSTALRLLVLTQRLPELYERLKKIEKKVIGKSAE